MEFLCGKYQSINDSFRVWLLNLSSIKFLTGHYLSLNQFIMQYLTRNTYYNSNTVKKRKRFVWIIEYSIYYKI